MISRYPLSAGGAVLAAALLAACAHAPETAAPAAADPSPPVAGDWPALRSAIAREPAVEARIDQILAGMSLRQKIGQMTQAEIKSITPAQVREYSIGSVLNGGGSWPAMDKHATVGDWLALADAYHEASMSADAATPIPIIWGTDAVHGHSNVYGATLFPHNIGLGAAHDAELIERIGAATARATRASGIHWVFAPTLAVTQDTRWGRSYESFAADDALVREYANAYVRGLQGDLRGDDQVVATAKHFIGDGATLHGKDQGVAQISRAQMIEVHAQGYFGAIEAGVQTVMASYNSWNDVAAGVDYGKMHGAKALLTDALKQRMGFDGFIVSDWNAIGQLPGCSNARCAAAINAGIDMVMVPDEWQAFIEQTTAQVERGEIPMARIDDAVRRILRVKLRAGLFERKPSDSRHAGDAAALVDRALARRAVRESLVLLKNDGHLLPLKRGQRVLVVGKSADSIPNQAGGWSLTWQGSDNTNADFPNADSLLAGVREAVGAGSAIHLADASAIASAEYDVAIAAIGETPYAETSGDLVASATVAHSRRHPEDLALLQALAARGKPVVTVFLSGRPLYANDLLNLSQAFVAAWLPGTEGKGVTDVLFAGADGGVAHDFRGRLTFPWPGVGCPDGRSPALFAPGFGLRHADTRELGQLPLDPAVSCGEATQLAVFNLADAAPFALWIAAGSAERAVGADLNATLRWPQSNPALTLRTVQVNTQQDAKEVRWLAPARLYARSATGNNLNALAQADAALQFDLVVQAAPRSAVAVGVECGRGCGATLDLARVFAGYPVGSRQTVRLPLACFAARGADLGGIDVPFSVSADAPFAAAFTRIAIVAGAAREPGALACDDFAKP